MTKLVFNLFQQSLVTLDCTELLENKKSIEGNFQLIKDWIRDEQKDSRYPPLLNREQAQWYNTIIRYDIFYFKTKMTHSNYSDKRIVYQ